MTTSFYSVQEVEMCVASRANRNQDQDEDSDIIVSYVKYLTVHISVYWHTLV